MNTLLNTLHGERREKQGSCRQRAMRTAWPATESIWNRWISACVEQKLDDCALAVAETRETRVTARRKGEKKREQNSSETEFVVNVRRRGRNEFGIFSVFFLPTWSCLAHRCSAVAPVSSA